MSSFLTKFFFIPPIRLLLSIGIEANYEFIEDFSWT